MRRLRNEDGAVAVIVTILAVVLFAFGAFAIDISNLWSERRQLQNGADGASLAIAQSCAAGDCNAGEGYQALAAQYADDNALDDTANVGQGELDQANYICGSGPGLPACTDISADFQPPGQGWVRVRTQTGSDASSGVVPGFLAQLLAPGYDGSTVHTSAVANWGAPQVTATGIALTFGECEWAQAVGATVNDDGSLDYTDVTFAPDPVYLAPTDVDFDPEIYGADGWAIAPGTSDSLERKILFKNPFGTSTDQTCDLSGAAYAGADLPGGFGWLDQNTDTPCTSEMVSDPTYGDVFDDTTGSTGQAAKDCSAALAEDVGHVVFIPVYSTSDGNGSNGVYHVLTMAAFYLTGYSFSNKIYHASDVTGQLCNADVGPQQTCISGFFTQAVDPVSTGKVANGPSLGATIVGLYE